MFGVAVLTSTPPSDRSDMAGGASISISMPSAAIGDGGIEPRRARSGTGGGFVGGRGPRTGPESSFGGGTEIVGWNATAGAATTGIAPLARGIWTLGVVERFPAGG